MKAAKKTEEGDLGESDCGKGRSLLWRGPLSQPTDGEKQPASIQRSSPGSETCGHTLPEAPEACACQGQEQVSSKAEGLGGGECDNGGGAEGSVAPAAR